MKTFIRISLCLLWTAACAGVLWLYLRTTDEGFSEQRIEEQYVLEYLNSMETEPPSDENETQDPLDPSDYEYSFDYSDDNWFRAQDGKTYTPDYASGEIFGVLEIPSIELRRGIYTGTWSDISHNLDHWMVTLSRPDYVIGKTHLCIYGHNATSQALSFNNLRYVHIGDFFTITRGNTVYFYEVTRFFAEWRENASKKYVNEMSLDPSLCYILTCGRDEYRYRDILVEGTMKHTFTLKEWNSYETAKWLGENYRTYKYSEEEKTVGVVEEKERLTLEVTGTTNDLLITAKDKDGVNVYCSVSVFDEDGFAVTDEIRLTGEPRKLALEEGTYVLGITDERYTANTLTMKIGKDLKVVTEEVKKQTFLEDVPRGLIYAAIGGLFVAGLALIILITKSKKEKRNV